MFTKIRVLLLLVICADVFSLQAQTDISGVVNTYVEVTAINTTGTCPGPGSTTITVTSVSGFAVGDRVLVIQMKGATADETNTSAFGDIIAVNNAGNYEFATISSIGGLDIVTNPLTVPFDATGAVQLVRVPVYASANVVGALTGMPWNGATGGVLAIEVTGALTLNASITMDTMGYRGAVNVANGPKSCGYNDYFYDETGVAAIDDDKRAAYKGEGIADFVAQKQMGKGKWTIGGGGGNSQNAGGGGGGNAGAGGRGGRHYDGCGATGAGHGVGGTTVTATPSKLFMGGGGGAGDNDDGKGTRGGHGGGIIIIYAGSIDPNSQTITASGEDTPDSSPGFNSGTDGMGGGGAGGTIAIECPTYSGANLTLQTNGGAGASSDITTGTWSYHGPGGGGGGGLVWLSTGSLPAGVSYTANGGMAGYTRNHDASRSHYEAMDGNPGIIDYGFLRNISNCALPVSWLSFNAKLSGGEVYLDWSTAWEEHNDYYVIERSADGKDFTSIGVIEGAGNSSQVIHYQDVDKSPLSGVSYYRIAQYDFDGSVSYSQVRSVSNTQGSIGIYPNPSDGNFTISLGISDSDVTIQLVDINGKIVGTYTLDQHQSEITVKHFPTGVYFARITCEGHVSVKRMMIF